MLEHVVSPAIRYAHSGDVAIAYRTLGEGNTDLVSVQGWVTHLNVMWENLVPPFLHAGRPALNGA